MKISLSVLLISFILGACVSSENYNPYVDDRINALHSEVSNAKKMQGVRKQTLDEMQNDIIKINGNYKNTVSEIQTSLLSGASPADKGLIEKWKTARIQLEKNNDVSFDMKMLKVALEKDFKILEYINDTVKGMDKIPGKTKDEQLELNKISADINILKNDIVSLSKRVEDESNNAMSFVISEKENLNDLALSIKEGKSSDLNVFKNTNKNNESISYSSFDKNLFGGYRSLIEIDMSKKTDYSEPLYHALSRALERDSYVSFQIVSIAPTMDLAKQNIEKVVDTLKEMGMPASRISIKSHTSASNQRVIIYTR